MSERGTLTHEWVMRASATIIFVSAKWLTCVVRVLDSPKETRGLHPVQYFLQAANCRPYCYRLLLECIQPP